MTSPRIEQPFERGLANFRELYGVDATCRFLGGRFQLELDVIVLDFLERVVCGLDRQLFFAAVHGQDDLVARVGTWRGLLVKVNSDCRLGCRPTQKYRWPLLVGSKMTRAENGF